MCRRAVSPTAYPTHSIHRGCEVCACVVVVLDAACGWNWNTYYHSEDAGKAETLLAWAHSACMCERK